MTFSLLTTNFTCLTIFIMKSFLHDNLISVIFLYRLNELNLGLQGVSTTIFNVRDKIEAMIKKLRLWLDCFPSLHDFLCANQLGVTDSVKRNITTHLSELAAQLYFPEADESDSWIRFPFPAVSAALQASEQESLIDVATSGSMKTEFNQKPLPDFWIGLCTEYPALAKRAVKTLMPFATTYLCESGFSALTSMTTKYRHRL